MCVCVGRKEMTPLIIYDQTFFGFFFFSLISSYVPVCVCEEVEAKGKQNIPPGQEIFECTTT